MDFTVDSSTIAQLVADTLTSFAPLLLTALGLVIAGGVVAWAIGMLKRWRWS